MSNNSDIDIRQVEMSECRQILKIETACFSDPWSLSDFEYQVNSPHSRLIGAYAGGEAVGFVNTVCIAGEIDVNNVAVMEQYRKMHIADRLLEYAFSLHIDAERAYLEVRESNIPAQKLYEKHGFIKYGERKNYYQNPAENAILMIKEMKDGK